MLPMMATRLRMEGGAALERTTTTWAEVGDGGEGGGATVGR